MLIGGILDLEHMLIDRNEDRVKEIQSIAYEHQVDDFLAGILYCSKYDAE